MGRMKDRAARFEALHFSVVTEARKLREICTSQPPTHPTFCIQEDLDQMPYRETDLGFFIVLVPGQMHSTRGNFTYVTNEARKAEGQAFMASHNVMQLSEGLLLVSSACTWDVVPRKLYQVRAVGYGVVAFTTPQRLQILAENPAHLR